MNNIFDLDVKMLRKAIVSLKESGTSYAEMERRSGAYNISRVASGEQDGTADTWAKLHFAFPLDIPEVTYLSGHRFKINVKKMGDAHQSSGDMYFSGDKKLSSFQSALIDLLNKFEDGEQRTIKIISELSQELTKIS